MHRMEKKSMPIQAPFPKADRERLERKVAYEQSKKDITKWEPLVKRNREASTLYFDDDIDLVFSTVGAIASEFEPRIDFEKKIASLVNDNGVVDAHKKDGARLLELNKISVEDVKDHQNHLAKMRSLFFRHELKAKRIKKIKSKAFHRVLKKDRLKAVAAEMEINPDAAKELAMKQEFKRAEDVQDEGTRAAISEQLHQHSLLARKMNSMKDNSSSDGSSDEDDDDDILEAKEKTLELREEEDEVPNLECFGSSHEGSHLCIISWPQVCGLKKRKEAADEEAKLALEEYESSLKQLEDKGVEEKVKKTGTPSGRRVFGAPKKKVKESSNKAKVDNYYGGSDSEDNLEAKEGMNAGKDRSNNFQKDGNAVILIYFEKSQRLHMILFLR
ncbi:hypothetical protein U1Q18_020054 [Sarracenia purpurea var. burkii]